MPLEHVHIAKMVKSHYTPGNHVEIVAVWCSRPEAVYVFHKSDTGIGIALRDSFGESDWIFVVQEHNAQWDCGPSYKLLAGSLPEGFCSEQELYRWLTKYSQLTAAGGPPWQIR